MSQVTTTTTTVQVLDDNLKENNIVLPLNIDHTHDHNDKSSSAIDLHTPSIPPPLSPRGETTATPLPSNHNNNHNNNSATTTTNTTTPSNNNAIIQPPPPPSEAIAKRKSSTSSSASSSSQHHPQSQYHHYHHHYTINSPSSPIGESPLKQTHPIFFKTTDNNNNAQQQQTPHTPSLKTSTNGVITAGPTFLTEHEQLYDVPIINHDKQAGGHQGGKIALNESTVSIDIPLHSSTSSINITTTTTTTTHTPNNNQGADGGVILLSSPLKGSTSSSVQAAPLLKQSTASSIIKVSGSLRKSRMDVPHHRHPHPHHHPPLNQSIVSDDHLVLASSSDYFPPPVSLSSSRSHTSAQALAAIPLVSLKTKKKKKKSKKNKSSSLEEVKYGEDDDGATGHSLQGAEQIETEEDGDGDYDEEDEDEEFVGYDQEDIQQQQQSLSILMEAGEIVLVEQPLYLRIWEKIKPQMGIVYMIISAFLFSLLALLVKLTSSSVSSLEIAFIRSFFGLIGCLIILGSMKINPLGDPTKRVFLTLRGLSGTISLTAYFFTLSVLPLSEAVCISFTSPVITAALAALILKERWGIIEAVCAFLSLFGVFIISKPPFLFGDPTDESLPGHLRLIYILVGLGGACASSFSFVAVRKVGPGTNPFILVLYFSFTSCVVLLPLTLLTKTFTIPPHSTTLVLLLLSFIALLAQGLVNRGIQLLKAGKAASINYIQIVFTFFWEVSVLKETVDVWTLLGAGLILCCAAITAFRK